MVGQSPRVEHRLLLAVLAAAAFAGGIALAYTELLRDPATGRWIADAIDRTATLLSLCR